MKRNVICACVNTLRSAPGERLSQHVRQIRTRSSFDKGMPGDLIS